MRSFDVIVIGAGPAGEVAAGRLGEAGRDVAVVEQELVGGECSYFACMPSKALLRPQEILTEVRRIPGAAEAVTGSLDVASALARRDQVIHDLDDSSQLPWLEERGVTVIRGRATVTRERVVEVEGGETLEAREAVILATGSSALLPPIDGLMEAKPLVSRDITTAKHVIERLVILGGGVVGVEMAQAWQSFGSQVILIEGERRLIPREETFACEQVTAALSEIGVEIRTGRKATAVRREAGQVEVTLDDGALVTGDEIVVAVGRRPNSAVVVPLGYEAGRPVEVDDNYRSTKHDWLYAVGDVNGRALLTHMGKYQARVAADHLTGRRGPLAHGADGPGSPRVIFTDPQVAAVGITSKTAEERGLNIRTVDVGTSGNAGGSFYGRGAAGTARLVVDEDRKVVVGATMTGFETADFIHAATIAIVGEVPLEKLWHCVPSFPTRSELWLRLLEEYGM